MRSKNILLLSLGFNLTSFVTNAQSSFIKDSLGWVALKDTAEFYVNNFDDRYDTALIYAKKTAEEAVKVFGDKNENYGYSLNDLAVVYYHKQQYPTAKYFSEKAFSVLKDRRDKDNPEFAAVLNVYAAIEEKLGNYATLEKLYKESLQIRGNLFAKDKEEYGFDYLESLNNLGNYYCNIEKFSLGEKYIKQAIDLQYKSGGKDAEYAILINNLANVYMEMGNYSKAEPLFKEALYIDDSIAGKGFDYGNTLNNLATLYTRMNNDAAAIDARQGVLGIILKVHHRKTVDYATTCTRLSELYIETGIYDSALALLQEADSIYQKELNADNPLYAETLDRIGSLYEKKNDLSNAALYYQKAKDLKEATLGTSSAAYSESLNSLGVIATKRGNYNAAKIYFDSASDIRLHQLGIQHPDYSESVNNILNLSYLQNDLKTWSKNVSFAIATWQNSVMHLLLSFDEKQKENYLDNHLQQKDDFLSMLYYFQQHGDIDSLSPVYYKMITAMQGWLLTGSRQLNSMIVRQHSPALSALYNKWILVKKKYTTAVELSAEQQQERNLDASSLLSRSEQMEMELIDSLSIYKEDLKNAGAFPSQISKKLNNGDAFITWVSFRYKAPDGWTDSTLYGAFILLPKDTVAHFVTLFEQGDIKKLLKYYHNAEGRGILKSNSSSIKNKDVDSALYQLIWKPLLKYIRKAKKIYTIPSGILNKISWYALADPSKKALLETIQVHLLTNVTGFLEPSVSEKKASTSITLLGGARFNGKNNIVKGFDENEAFPYLQGTEEEVKEVSLKFARKGWQVQLDTGYAASEENFKKISGDNAPFILHIATHGFYKADTSPASSPEFPLLRSGLVLAGANLFWERDTVPAPGTDDGIVTAQEVANLDFTKTHLVTLSACETALGDINNNEGVYGLQRAFKIAGVKKMLITLWEIPDIQTKELMNLFYDAMLKGDTYYNALRKAQLKMKSKYHDPAVWAGFELIE